jgi:hypothetical protein
MKHSESPHRKIRNRFWKTIFITILILIIIRLALPYVILSYANKTLANLEGYTGHIEDIDISIIRGAYGIKSIYIDKIDSLTNKGIPFISSDAIDFSIEWNALFKGEIVSNAAFYNPTIRFTKDKTGPEKIDTLDFRMILKRLMPIKINNFEVENGLLQYIDSSSKPIVNLEMQNIYLLAQNFTNKEDTALLPASLEVNSSVYDGIMKLNMKLNPLSDFPAFDMNFELQNINLQDLNDFFKAYANIDINKGTFSLYGEIAGRENKYLGYVKPVIKDLEVLGQEDRKDSFFNKIWEGIVELAGDILKNKEKEQVATKIPISGEYNEASVKIWYSIITILKNAFIQALYPSIDYEINQSTVKKITKEDNEKILEKILNKDSGEDKKKESKLP